MNDVIELRGLRVLAVIGALPEERDRAQPFELDLDVEVDTAAAGRSDALEDTVDYGALVARAEAAVCATSPQLLERVAQIVADEVLACDARIDGVRVVIRKLRPPVPQDLRTAAVAITRRRSR